jgi:hypothetical protein
MLLQVLPKRHRLTWFSGLFDAGGQYRPYRGRITVMRAEELF